MPNWIKKGLCLEQFPKLKLRKVEGGFFLSKKFVRSVRRELRKDGVRKNEEKGGRTAKEERATAVTRDAAALVKQVELDLE